MLFVHGEIARPHLARDGISRIVLRRRGQQWRLIDAEQACEVRRLHHGLMARLARMRGDHGIATPDREILRIFRDGDGRADELRGHTAAGAVGLLRGSTAPALRSRSTGGTGAGSGPSRGGRNPTRKRSGRCQPRHAARTTIATPQSEAAVDGGASMRRASS